MQLQLDFWQYEAQLSRWEEGGRALLYDPIRRRKVSFTPEEWLRQLVLQYLLKAKNYPPGLMRTEVGLTLNGMPRRCDIVVFDRQLRPWLLVECKSPKIPLAQSTFEQVARYNLVFQAPFLAITNGTTTFCAHLNHEHGTFHFLPDFPHYPPQARATP